MAAIDLVDETFIAASPDLVARVVADRRRWVEWWPDLELRVFMDRGSKGIRWSVSGGYVGSMEIWLEPCIDGVILHYYLRIDLGSGEMGSRRAVDRARASRARAWKAEVWRLKDELEATRAPGAGAAAGE